eukprot:2110664-Pleurochrysis_carterae.AAC.2
MAPVCLCFAIASSLQRSLFVSCLCRCCVCRLSDHLWQLLAGVVLNVLLLVVVRRDVDEPLWLDLDYLAHELFRGVDELVVDDPARLRAVERRRGVDVYRLRVLHCAVVERLLQLGRVVEEAGRDALADA